MLRVFFSVLALMILLGTTLLGPGVTHAWGRWRAAESISAFASVSEEQPFVFYFPDAESEKATAVREAAARAREEVARRLGAWPKGWQHHIVLVRDRETMRAQLQLRPGDSAIAAYHRSMIWVREDADPFGPLVHEMAHEWLDLYGRGRVPSWFHEGVAQWLEYQATGFEWVEPGSDPLAPGVTPYQFEELSKNFSNLPDQALSYRQCFLLVKDLHRRFVENESTEHDDMVGQERGRGRSQELVEERFHWIGEVTRAVGQGHSLEDALFAKAPDWEPMRSSGRQ